MKSVAFFLTALSLFTTLVRGSMLDLEARRTHGGYVQKGSGNATFTVYSGCTAGPGKFVLYKKHIRTD